MAVVHRPERKNRRFGTKARGYGQNNRLEIPNSWREMTTWREKLGDYRVITLTVCGRELPVIIERPHPEFYYALTPEDVAHVLAALPEGDWDELEFVVFRQSTRKQRILSGAWARIQYFTEIDRYEGVAIFFEALATRWRWTISKSLTPDDARELRRLERLGVTITQQRRQLLLTSSPEADRNIQLYHSLLHELGHLDDWKRHDRFCLHDEDDRAAESERRIDEGTPHYDHKPAREREIYAHRFSDERRAALRDAGVIPFARRLTPTLVREAELDAAWFTADERGA